MSDDLWKARDRAWKLSRERNHWKADCLEQAKLLAISADREDKLRADLMLARKLADSAMLEADRYRAALKNIAALDTSQDASPQQCGAVLLAMNALDP